MINLKYDENNPYNLKLQENVILEYLKEFYLANIRNNYKYFNNDKYVYLPIEYLRIFNLTPFKQREILNKLESLELIECKFGQAKARYFRVLSSELQNKKEQIMKNLKKLNSDTLDKLLKICESEEE